MNASARATAVAVVLLAATLAGQEPDDKIDRELLGALAGNASLPFFAVFKDRADLRAIARIPDRAARGRAVVQALHATANASQAAARAYLQSQRAPFTAYWIQNAIFVAKGTLALARALAQLPEVAAIVREPVFAIPTAQAGQPASTQAIEWNVAQVRADQVWPTTRGAGIVVSNIDTGARYTHSALVRQYRGNVGGTFNHAGNWRDPTGVCGPVPCDNSGHGTHVMGTMVGDDGTLNHIGVAPEARWVACKGCANESACYGSHLMTCAQWIMDPLGDGSGNNQPDIVNNSWAGGSGDAWFMSFVDNWRVAGIFPAFAQGNMGPACGTAASPGDYPQSVAAGASDGTDVIATFSARGPSRFVGTKPNATAPGVSVRSSAASGNDAYATMSGTSMASPHVAGTVALIWAAQPALRGKVALTGQLVEDTAVRLISTETCGATASQIPNNTYGYGRIDALAAVTTSPPPNEPPTVTITKPSPGALFNCPATVSFGAEAGDPENGNLTSSISWHDNGAGFGAGGAASRSYTCIDAGSHNITASVTDGGRLTDTNTITIQILAACRASGASCTSNRECCSNKCSGKAGAKVCR